MQKRETNWKATFSFINSITNEEVIDALRTMQTEEPIGKGQGGIVYKLGNKVSGHAAVVKVIYGPEARFKEGVLEEAKHLYQVGQLYGVGHTQDKEYWYLVMPYMGMPFGQAEKRGLEMIDAVDLISQAYKIYKNDCHLMHE